MAKVLKTPEEQIGYALGRDTALAFIQKRPVDFNFESFILGFQDAKLGRESLLPDKDYRRILQNFHDIAVARTLKNLREIIRKNMRLEKKFISDNKAKKEVVTTKSGLQYIELKKGSGPRPGSDDLVKIHYEGKLPDGTVFDSSLVKGAPEVFVVKHHIPGLAEAFQLMSAGSKFRVFIPADLAYGKRGDEKVGPGCMLIFDVELLEILK
jgi:FKBP-type peptidyl-prolyl cis-trans isomerase